MRCSTTQTGSILEKSQPSEVTQAVLLVHADLSPLLHVNIPCSAALSMLWAVFLQLWLTKMDFWFLPIAWVLSLSLSLLSQPTSHLLHFLSLFQICDSTHSKKVQHKYVQKQFAIFCSFHQGDLVSRKWDSRGAEDTLQSKIVCPKETPRPQDPYHHVCDTWCSCSFRNRDFRLLIH